MDCIFKDDLIKYLLEADIIIENKRNSYKILMTAFIILMVFILY